MSERDNLAFAEIVALRESVRLADEYIALSPCDPDIYHDQWAAWQAYDADKRKRHAGTHIAPPVDVVAVCTGCGSRPISAARAVLQGKAACCPDCSTFTVDERNELRALSLQPRQHGLTREDVAFLRRNAEGFRLEHPLEPYASLANRIEALLMAEAPDAP